MKPHPRHSHRKPTLPADRFWIWGKHAVLAALENPKRKCFRILATSAAAKEINPQDIKCEVLEAKDLSQRLPEGAVHQGVAVEVAPLEEEPFSILKSVEEGTLLVLDQVTDPHNVGAILRTAKALGALGVVMCERSAPPLSGVLAKTASGAVDKLPVWKVTNLSRFLDKLKEMGFWTVGLDERATETIRDAKLPTKLALIMGAEGEGLRRLTQEKCDFFVKLPTDPEFPTLNVSVAAALALYATKKSSN